MTGVIALFLLSAAVVCAAGDHVIRRQRLCGCMAEAEQMMAGRLSAYLRSYEEAESAFGGGHRFEVLSRALLGKIFAEWSEDGCGNTTESAPEDRGSISGQSDVFPSSAPDSRRPLQRHSSFPDECLALADIFDATNGTQWLDGLGWTDRATLLSNCCRAKGVGCDSEGRVVSLKLPGNNLRGRVPPSISRLRQLQDLYVGTFIVYVMGAVHVLISRHIRCCTVLYWPPTAGSCNVQGPLWTRNLISGGGVGPTLSFAVPVCKCHVVPVMRRAADWSML